jgi:hypothetical protein
MLQGSCLPSQDAHEGHTTVKPPADPPVPQMYCTLDQQVSVWIVLSPTPDTEQAAALQHSVRRRATPRNLFSRSGVTPTGTSASCYM